MKELNDIIIAYDRAVLQNKRTALATVVKVEGSSYRRPGARMLVTEDGEITGAISGGCLEGDALRKAQFAIFQQKNKLEIYDTNDEDDLKFGVQLGCNGIVYILFEPIKNNDAGNPINLLKKIGAKRKDAILVTVFSTDKNSVQKGTCCFVNEEESIFRSDEMRVFQTECIQILEDRLSVIKDYPEGFSVLFQFVPPSVQLIVIGAGNDAQSLMDIAFLLGWYIIVIDGRPVYATQQRFPKANKIAVAVSSEILRAIKIDEQTAIVLMTHNYNYDIAAVEQLINTNCNYIGVLGPKKKLLKMFNDLKDKGIVIDDKLMKNTYSPVGLDIGAETSEEISLSIIAEIMAVFAKRKGSSLKERPTEIHIRATISNHD
jgi:xanthine/CO dehydrogenase XdhC/CoxF family maturation factor